MILKFFFVLIIQGYRRFPQYNTPISDRIRKRRAFADKELDSQNLVHLPFLQQQHQQLNLFTTNNNYLHSPTDFINYSTESPKIRVLQESELMETEVITTTTRPKLSFSIESIIGIK